MRSFSRFFENPLRRARAFARSWRGLILWPATVAAVSLAAFVGIWTVPAASQAAITATARVVRTSGDPAIAAITAAVKPARLKTKIHAAALTPSVASLPADIFHMKGCTAGYGNATSGPICHWGDTTGAKTMIVFGDSHVEMWMLPLSSYAAANGWQLIPLTKAGCHPTSWSGSSETPACKSWFSWAVNEATQLAPDAIVVGTEYSGVSATSQSFNTLVEQGMSVEIKALAAATTKLLVLQDTPHAASSPVDCLLAPHATFASCTFAISPQAAAVDAAVRQEAASAHAAFLPTRQWFCSRGKCPMVVGSTIAYIDQGHITQEYARALSVPLATELGAALR